MNMNLIARAGFAFACMVAVGFGSATAATPSSARPNVLLICVDDLKPVLGCYDDTVIKSPNIDRLTAGGMVFESAYCNQAVCSPSRNALMTGLRSTTLGIYDLPTNFRVAAPDAVTVAQYFKQHGWVAGGPVVARAEVSGERHAEGLTVGLEPLKKLGELRELGWKVDTEMPEDTAVTAFRLEGAEGDEYWLGLPNFYVITRYNRSVMYAMAVHQLAEKLAQARGEG